ncbi:MAG: CRISPR system precrRNA processing endoribonuclease RAMP protein Cas6 [Elusimicrobia bacterium]|nr:CRISPR system precrRNA processing endoribonuclease RAMP protein Cas6 [Elusimicrobiota bacterium]
MLNRLKFIKLIFSFVALEKIIFPCGLKGNIFRGAFGFMFKRLADKNPSAEQYHDISGLYEKIFSPRIEHNAPSGLKDVPRSFVFNPCEEERNTIYQGESFSLGINIFGWACAYYPHFIRVMAEIGNEGIGPLRGKYAMRGVYNENCFGKRQAVFDKSGMLCEIKPSSITQMPEVETTVFKIEFLSPAEIKYEGRIQKNPLFHHIFRRLRDRISSIAYFHHGMNLGENYEALALEAEKVETLMSQWRWVELKRRSSKTLKYHNLSGVIGSAVFDAGNTDRLKYFLPWLKLGEITNVGKNSVWGMGKIKTEFNLEGKYVYMPRKEMKYAGE